MAADSMYEEYRKLYRSIRCGELPAQAETDETRTEGTRHSSVALICCQHWACELSDDKITSLPDPENTRATSSFQEKKKKS